MQSISRRQFLQISASLVALMGLDSTYQQGLAEGLENITSGKRRIVWLQGQACSGCTISFLNANNPTPATVLTQMVSLAYHRTIGAAQGQLAYDHLARNLQQPGYLLVIEGSIPMTIPEACIIDSKPLMEVLPPAIDNAEAVIAIGTCAVFGGIPAAEGNPTGATSVINFMKTKGLDLKKLICLPTCPTHPESLIGSLAYYDKYGVPARDSFHRPKLFYSCSIHAECPRYHYYQNEIFAQNYGDEHGCLFKLGCLGPLSFANCPRRQWNGGINWCIRANAPCLSCSSEHFAISKDLPFYRKGEKYRAFTQSRKYE